MRAFLEKCGTEWLDDFVYSSVLPLRDMGINVIAFNGDDLVSFKDKYFFDIKTDIIIGSVEATKMFFEECGVQVPKYLGYPDQLKEFLHRKMHISDFKDISEDVFPYFVKPVDGVKDFTGTTVENKKQFTILKQYYPLTDDTKLYVSDLIDIKSEWRCFVHKGELKGMHWYKGDFSMFPDLGEIIKMIKSYKKCPVSYTLDVGIIYKTGTELTCLVEINDFWAIGSYGFDAKTYVRMIIDRFQEIANEKSL